MPPHLRHSNAHGCLGIMNNAGSGSEKPRSSAAQLLWEHAVKHGGSGNHIFSNVLSQLLDLLGLVLINFDLCMALEAASVQLAHDAF